MRGRLALFLTIGALLTACGGPMPAPDAPTPVAQRACDDGGSGGVLIDGICL